MRFIGAACLRAAAGLFARHRRQVSRGPSCKWSPQAGGPKLPPPPPPPGPLIKLLRASGAQIVVAPPTLGLGI